jgi:hypothetical protein
MQDSIDPANFHWEKINEAGGSIPVWAPKLVYNDMAIGTLMGIMASLPLEPEKAHRVWQLLKMAVSGVVKLLGT